jgi:hypothetical protein
MHADQVIGGAAQMTLGFNVEVQWYRLNYELLRPGDGER